MFTLSNDLKAKLKRLPFAGQAEKHLRTQGHTPREAEWGALFVAGLDVVVFIILFNSFLAGMLLSFTHRLSFLARQYPSLSVLLALTLTFVTLLVIFRLMKGAEEKREKEEREVRRAEGEMAHKRESLQRGAMGNFETIFRAEMAKKHPDIDLTAVWVVDTTPRVRFRMARFTTAESGTDADYKAFREKLFADTLNVVSTVFALSPNIPAVLVDAMFQYISRKAVFYDGAVLSVKASREVYRALDLASIPSFKALTFFDLRYNDGQEVEPHPEEESRNARVLERLKREMPKADIHYETARPVTPSFGGTAAPPAAVAAAMGGKAGEFQERVTSLLARQGFEIRQSKRIPGGTLEFMVTHPHPILGGAFVVLARQYSADTQVHAEMVTELDTLVRDEGCQKGLYFVTGRFTEEARNIARYLPLTLVDGERLREVETLPAGNGRVIPTLPPEEVPDLERLALPGFQEAVERFLKGLDFRVVRIRKLTEGSIFSRVEFDHPLIGGEMVIMAKQFTGRAEVTEEIVRETARIREAEFCRRGILLVTGTYTAESRAIARSMFVELVDGPRWRAIFPA